MNIVVSPLFIRDYLSEKFKEDSRLSSGDEELIVPSIFVPDDYKRHMSINLESGLWQCFKTGNKGNFIQIYAFIESMSYNKAEAEILFKEFEAGYSERNLAPVYELPQVEKDELHLVPVTVHDYESEDRLVLNAWTFLYERKLFNLETEDSKYYVSTEGRYAGRLIIPFEEEGDLFYFQARTLYDEQPKYLNPSEGWPKSSHILYPFDMEADSVVVCEGPLDAISLQIKGVNATCTLGCSVSEHQVEALKEFEGKIIIGYDNDDAGKRGINKFDYLRRLKRMADLYICHPPSEFKDWNDALLQDTDLRGFVERSTKRYDYDYLMTHLLTTL